MTYPNDRRPPIPRDRISDGQRATADELVAGPRKRIDGPFIALLRNRERMTRFGAAAIADQGTPTLSSCLDPRAFERAGALGTSTRLEIQVLAAHAADA